MNKSWKTLILILVLVFVFSPAVLAGKVKLGAVLWAPHKLSEPQLQFAAEHTSWIVLGGSLVSLQMASTLKSFNPNVVLFWYMNSRHVVPDSWKYREMGSDEDLFAHDSDGYRVWNTLYDQYLMDVQNPGWVDRLIEWADLTPVSVDGVFLDDAAPTLWVASFSSLPEGYDPDQYAAAMGDLLHTVKQNTAGLVAFNGFAKSLDHADYGSGLDGSAFEGFVFDRFSQDLSTARITRDVAALIEARKASMTVATVAKSYKEDIGRRVLAFACFLLGFGPNNNTYSFAHIPYIGDPEPEYYPEYDIDLGKPLSYPNTTSDLINARTGLAYRTFTKGLVIVNHTGSDKYVRLPITYLLATPSGGGKVSPDGTVDGYLDYTLAYGTIIVEPYSGMILLDIL